MKTSEEFQTLLDKYDYLIETAGESMVQASALAGAIAEMHKELAVMSQISFSLIGELLVNNEDCEASHGVQELLQDIEVRVTKLTERLGD